MARWPHNDPPTRPAVATPVRDPPAPPDSESARAQVDRSRLQSLGTGRGRRAMARPDSVNPGPGLRLRPAWQFTLVRTWNLKVPGWPSPAAAPPTESDSDVRGWRSRTRAGGRCSVVTVGRRKPGRSCVHDDDMTELLPVDWAESRSQPVAVSVSCSSRSGWFVSESADGPGPNPQRQPDGLVPETVRLGPGLGQALPEDRGWSTGPVLAARP